MKIIVSETVSPSFNLASEHFLFTEYSQDVLFFYINSPCVVLGRNQNIYAEVNLPFCRSNGIGLVRRMTGGGSVYHDEGNINFCFIICHSSNPLDSDYLSEMEEALASFGVFTTRGDRKDLFLNGGKISGTALHSSAGNLLFHGTLLFDSDLQLLREALESGLVTESRAVKSVSSRVVNIREQVGALSSLSTRGFLQKIIRWFSAGYHTQPAIFSLFEKEEIARLQSERYATWESVWGQNPQAVVRYPVGGQPGGSELILTIDGGYITRIESDDAGLLKGCRFTDI
jgi:lipoate-protein ligase A